MEEKIKEFWSIYDQYILSGDVKLHPQLSILLAEIEKPSRNEQLLRPEKGWTRILGWQVLRTQEFYFAGSSPWYVHQGELIIWNGPYDRDIFVTRIPIYETISGHYLKPGYCVTFEDKKPENIPQYDWDRSRQLYGIVNEKGLYLPIFDLFTLMKFCDIEIAKIRPGIINSIKTNLFLKDEDFKNL